MIVGKSGSREISSLLVRAILPGFFFFFFLVWARSPQRRTCRGDIFSVKTIYKIKSFIYNIYTTQSFRKVLGKNVFSLWLVQFEWIVNHKKILCSKKEPNIPGAKGDRENNSQHHKNFRSDFDRGGCTILIGCQISFLRHYRSHSWLVRKIKLKQLLFNLFLTNLSDILQICR